MEANRIKISEKTEIDNQIFKGQYPHKIPSDKSDWLTDSPKGREKSLFHLWLYSPKIYSPKVNRLFNLQYNVPW